MKSNLLALVLFMHLLSCNLLFSQGKIIQNKSSFYEEVIAYAKVSEPYSIVVNQEASSKLHDNALKQYQAYQLSAFVGRNESTPNTISFTIPYGGKKYTCILKKSHLRSRDYKLMTAIQDQRDPAYDASYYQGVIKGEPHSWVTLAVINGKYKLLMASPGFNFELTHLIDSKYLGYTSDAIRDVKSFECLYEEDALNTTQEKGSDTRAGSDCVELYIECDYQSFQDNNNSVASTEAWAMSVMNDVSTMYNAINVPLVVNQIFVWNTADPYISLTSVQAIRDTFVSHTQNNYNGRIAQLFSTRPLNQGLAYGLGGICGNANTFPGPYFVATSMSSTYDPYPNYSFTSYVVAHELGHVFGARHTHACVWGPNGNTQIDDCGNLWAIQTNNTPEGLSCLDTSDYILPASGGTIMSRCDLAGGGIVLSNGFGTEVGEFITDAFQSAICATGYECASIPPSNDDCTNATPLTLKGVCSFVTYDNFMASPSGVGNPSCGTPGNSADVWFSLTSTGEDISFFFKSDPNGVQDAIITIYSGTCSSLTEISCNTASNETLLVKIQGIPNGQKAYIRVIESGSNVEGNFELCAVVESLPCDPAFTFLIDLYNSTYGNTWTNNAGWQDGALGNSCDVCSWYGVTCDNLGRVIGLDLHNNNLSGTLPSTLGELTYLRTLKLFQNDLTGLIPDVWNDMDDIEFVDLSHNGFTGPIPGSLGTRPELQTLYLENNLLSGGLIPSLGNLPDLDVMWLKNNNFSGCIPGTYLNLCDATSIKLEGNPNLPDGGVFLAFCDFGIGGDIDEDGFCYGFDIGDDCVDDDNTIYPNAPEICDGKDNDCDNQYDENLASTNTYVGPNIGKWDINSNWSLGHIPLPCEDVVFGSSANFIFVEIDFDVDARARSITINNNNQLINDGMLTVSGSDDLGFDIKANGYFSNNNEATIRFAAQEAIELAGQIINNGTIYASNVSSVVEVRLIGQGNLSNGGSGQLIIR